jgi:hypothetical protein
MSNTHDLRDVSENRVVFTPPVTPESPGVSVVRNNGIFIPLSPLFNDEDINALACLEAEDELQFFKDIEMPWPKCRSPPMTGQRDDSLFDGSFTNFTDRLFEEQAEVVYYPSGEMCGTSDCQGGYSFARIGGMGCGDVGDDIFTPVDNFSIARNGGMGRGHVGDDILTPVDNLPLALDVDDDFAQEDTLAHTHLFVVPSPRT